jgi:hypothetical protein
VDWYLMPMMFIGYGLVYYDKVRLISIPLEQLLINERLYWVLQCCLG